MGLPKLVDIGRLKLSGDYKSDVSLMLKALSNMENHIYDKLVPAAQVTTIFNTNISGEGGTHTTISVRWIKLSLSANVATSIYFTPSFTLNPAVAQPRCYNSSGQSVGFDMTTPNTSVFTVTPMEDCFFECVAAGI